MHGFQAWWSNDTLSLTSKHRYEVVLQFYSTWNLYISHYRISAKLLKCGIIHSEVNLSLLIAVVLLLATATKAQTVICALFARFIKLCDSD